VRIGNECSFAKTYAASPSLLVLVRHSKEVVTKDDLMKMVWPDTFVEGQPQPQYLHASKSALGETAPDHRFAHKTFTACRRTPEKSLETQSEFLGIYWIGLNNLT
jgi:hypothetical protein